MRIPRPDPDCGPLLDLEQIRRQLRLGAAVPEGNATIPVTQIVGTAGRSRDFDACWRPVHTALRKRLDDIVAAAPTALDEAIEVVRVDRAYFVVDGHKRVALAHRTGREFIDARISHLPSPYALTPQVEIEAIDRTAREGEFRRHSGVHVAVPEARFALTDVTGYGELLMAVQSFAFDRILATGRAITAPEAARLWYDERYRPTVESGRRSAAGLIEGMTDADVFLALHRQERATFGSECGEAACVADMLLAEQRRVAAGRRSPLDRILHREPTSAQSPALLLPLANELSTDAPLTTDEDQEAHRSSVHHT